MKTTAILATLALMSGVALNVQAMAQDAPVNLTWQMWGSDENDVAAWQHLADMVTEVHPEITVTLQTAPWNDYWTKLPVLAASGQMGDIVAMQSLRMPNFYSLLEPLDERIAAEGFDIDAFDSSIIGGMSHDGVVYGLPYDVGPWMMFYNKDRFEAAGLELPAPGWTLDDFKKAAAALTADGEYGVGISPGNYSIFAGALGASYVNAEGQLDLTNPDAVAAADEFIGLVSNDKVAPLIASGANPGDVTSGRFESGNVAMLIDGPWSLISKNDTVAFSMGLAPLPRGEGDLQAVTAGSGFGVATTSQNKDAAWKAIQVITGPEALKYLAEAGRALPARKAEQTYWFDVAAAEVTGAREALEYSLAHSATYQITANWNAVENLFNQYFPLAMTGNQTPEETMTTIQSLAQSQ